MDDIDLSLWIEHTLLKPEASTDDVRRLCAEAVEHHFVGVCVSPSRVPDAREVLGSAPVALVTTAGFPLGSSTTDVKVFEAERAWGRGATDIDFVLNVGWAREGNWDAVRSEFSAMRLAVPEGVVKVILETGLLDEAAIRTACEAAVDSGLDFVKTSTGFGPRGASVEDIILMKEVVGETCRIKASGGIRTREQALAMVKAGAHRLGTSAGPALLQPSQ